MTDEYTIFAGQLSQPTEYISNLFSPDFINSINNLSDNQDPATLFDEFSHLSRLDITYLYALVYGKLEHQPHERGIQSDEIGNILRNVNDKQVESFITELIQNAQDIQNNDTLLKMGFEYTQDNELHFSHNSVHFSPSELRAACRIGNSTKTVNLHTIGRFGLGLKYWRMFFSRVRIASREGHIQHSLVEENHSEGDEFIPFVEKSQLENDAERTTKFTFSKPNKEFLNQFESVSSLFSERLSLSLPLLTQPNQNGVLIAFRQHEEGDRVESILKSSSVKLIETQSSILLEIMKCKQDGHERLVLKSSLPISSFKESLSEHYDALEKALADDYIEILAARGISVESKTAQEKIAESLESTESPLYLSVAFDPILGFNGGYLASKFIGLQTKFESAPFLIDAPFRLEQNRQKLNMGKVSFGVAINTPLVHMISTLLEKTLPHTFSGAVREALSLDVQHYDQLLNGSFKMETSPEFTKLFEKNTQLFSILKSTPDCGVVKGDCAAPASLMHYWRTMLQRGIDTEWFWNALNPRIARIEIEHGDAGPIQVLLGENIVPSKLDMTTPWFDGIYGDGIPGEIFDLYLELNEVQLNESQHLGTTITPFDGGDVFFASEKANRFVKKFEFEADTTTPKVDAFHRALGQTLRASSSEHELYGVVHEHRAGTKTTWKPTKDLKIISHLFELSLNQEDETVLSEHNICNQLETRFREDVQSENAPKTYTLLKDSQNNLTLVKRPEAHFVACVLVGDDQYEMCSIKYTKAGLVPTEISFEETPSVKVWGSHDNVTWFTLDVDLDVPKPNTGNVTEMWKRVSIHTNPDSIRDWNWIRLNQFVDTAPKNIDRIVIVDLLQHNKDVELSQLHSLGIYADTRNKLNASSFDGEYKPKNKANMDTRNITPLQNSVDQILLSKVLFQTDKFPQKTKAKFPNDEPWLSFSQMNHKCTAEDNQDILVMDDTGFVSVGMTLRADQSDKIYHVKDILDENKLRLSTKVEKSINDEILYFNDGKVRRQHAILRFLDLATHVSLTADDVNEDELSSFLDAYDNARWLKGKGKKTLTTYAYDCYWRARKKSLLDLKPRCTKIHAGSSDIGVITAKPDGMTELPRIFDNILGFTENYPLDVHQHAPRDLMLRKYAGVAHPLPFVVKPEDEVSVPLIEGVRGFVVDSDHSLDFYRLVNEGNVLELMVRGVLNEDNETADKYLRWLNNLLENYDIEQWFGRMGIFDWNGNSKYPSNHLRDCLEVRESFVEEKFKSDYSKLHGVIFSKQRIPWSSVQESIIFGSTAQEIKSTYAEAVLPQASVKDGILTYEEDGGAKASALGKNDLLIEEELDLTLLQVLNIKDEMRVVLPSQGQNSLFADNLFPILTNCKWISDCPTQSIFDILIRKTGPRGTEVEDDAIPPAFSWLPTMRNKIREHVRLSILQGGEDQPDCSLHYSNNSISMVVHKVKSSLLDVDVYLPSTPSFTLSYEQWRAIYELFMKTIQLHSEDIHPQIPKEIDQIFNSLAEVGPWSPNARDDCIHKFSLATNQLNNSEYKRYKNASATDVDRFLNDVARRYRHDGESISDTKESIRRQKDRYYGNLQGVLSKKWSANSQLHRLRSIWEWALPNEDKKRMREAGLPKGSIGEYLLLNLEEDGWFSARQDADMIRCKFVDDYASLMKTALIEQCSADASVQHVEIPDLVFEEKSGKTLTMVFNKVHLFFIIGGLRAGGVPNA